ncbi:MAG: T9SS type A sorting domain-containing protein [Flavobacteriales bacterium]|nr:MAG: T9SS type A sorting domain-containing protein [Flavobacteriales bacterium]
MKHLFASALLGLVSLTTRAQPLYIAEIKGTAWDMVGDMAVDGQGNTILVGHFGGICDFDPGPGTMNIAANGLYDGFVAKYDPNGALLWAGKIGGIGDQRIFTVVLDSADNIHLGGWFEQTADLDPGPGSLLFTSAGEFDGFFSKLDPAGQLIWASVLPNTGRSFVSDMDMSPATGDLIITGCFLDTIDMDPSPNSYPLSTDPLGAFYEKNTEFLARYTSGGALLWAKRIGGGNEGPRVSVHNDGLGNEVINWGTVGEDDDITTTDLDPGSGSVHPTGQGALQPAEWIGVVQFNANGDYQWSHLIRGHRGSVGGIPEDLLALVTDAAGNILIAGQFDHDFTAYPNNAVTLAPFGVTNYDGFLIKLSPSGALIWEKHMGNGASGENESLVDIAIDATGNYWVSGVFAVGAEMDSDALGHTIGSNGEFDIAVIGFDPSGGYLYHGTVGGDWYDASPHLCTVGSDLLLSGSYGTFQGTADLDISSGIQSFTAIDTYDAFITRFAPSISTGVVATAQGPVAVVFPNPADHHLWLRTAVPGEAVEVFDALGQHLLTTRSGTIDVGSWSEGIYFATSHGRTERIIIQH